MPISIICPGCHKRFKVSDQFAGKKGPCPDCKTMISIPTKEEEVVIHAPEQFGPKGASGQAVLKPIEREETRVTPVIWAVSIGLAVLIPTVALVLRLTIPWSEATVRWLVLGIGGLLIAPPLVLLGYSFLRDSELQPYRGTPLLIRVSICSVIYAVLWGVYLYVTRMLGLEQGPELPQLVYLIPMLILPGAITAVASLDLDNVFGTLHYCMYLGVCVVLRLIMGLGPF